MGIKAFIFLINLVTILIFSAKCKQIQEDQEKILFYIQEYERRKDSRELTKMFIQKEQSLNNRKQTRKYRNYRFKRFW